jgi:hypothetical protein
MPNDTITHVREDAGKISNATGRAVFETAAEVLGGLVKAHEDYEARSEGAWRG